MNLLLAGLLGLSNLCTQTPTDFSTKLIAPENRIAFENDGGLANGGVCWWHSRFQRAAWSLAIYQPELEKPNQNETLRIVRTIIAQSSVVVIPGYANLYEFTQINHSMVQHELEQWQIRDGFINQAWIRGISGRASLPAPRLKSHLDEIFSKFKIANQKQEVLWLMLQIKGIVSHASLLVEMNPRANGGYQLKMVDSNEPTTLVRYEYKNGDTTLSPAAPSGYANEFRMVPYLGLKRDLDQTAAALKMHCGS